jgi:hypothetical protein
LVPGNLIAEPFLEIENCLIACDDFHGKIWFAPVKLVTGIYTGQFGTTMSNKNNNDSIFSNQDTLVRRAWINSALDSVRSRLGYGTENDSVAENSDSNAVGQPPVEPRQPEAAEHQDSSEQPHLYVAWSSRERRSGT